MRSLIENTDMMTLANFLQTYSDALINEWSAAVAESWKQRQDLISESALQDQCSKLMAELVQVAPTFNPADMSWEPDHASGLITLLQDVGALWAHQGLKASETSTFVLTLKHLIADRMSEQLDTRDNGARDLMQTADRLLDRLLVICHDVYIRNREKLIKQQSHALLELSSPVVKMWDGMLLLPLIGVIDTKRARQITEALLSEIARQEALVTVVDLTGVPVFDTAVAGHLMKTIKAAQMLGCRIIMTGISPEGALVLTKLGIDFHNVITRANLHSGVREGFRMLDVQVFAGETASHGA